MRTKLLTIFLAPMLLFSFTTVFGQSLNNTIDMNAPFTVNTEVHSVQNTLEGGPITEVFGLNENMFGPSGLRGRGNIFLCTTPRKLIEHLFYLNLTAAANMWFVVYEGATPQGNYNLVHSINVPNQGPGEAWYSSGAIDFDFQAGMYYAIYAQWDANANYWNQQNISPYPIAASFGELQSGVGWNWAPIYGDPPPATQDVQEGFIDPVAYYQTIVTDDIGGGTVSIAYAIEDLDGDFIPDHLGETVTVEGVVFSPNFQTTNNSFYIWDEVTTSSSGASRGTDIFMFGPPVFDWQPGDLLQITGEVDQFNGMTEIIPADSSGWVLVSSGNPTPDLIELTLAQYKADPEAYEGSLVGFISLTLVGGTWPTGGSSVNLDFSDGIDTCVFRIDSDTDIGGQPEPVWPRDILGVGSQFDNSPPFDGGYQIFPRYYATDFLPPNTIPVELTSFTAQANDGAVYLNWTTATEQNNQGFEVQRSTNNQFTTIGFVSGSGTTTEIHNYSFTDTDVQTGTYYYRLKQVDYNGVYDYSDVIQVEVAPVNFALEQNYPNPFNPSTKITFSLAVDSKVSLKVFDVLGQEVTKLITTNMTAGVHEVIFDASSLNSGVYFYQLEATASDGTNFTSVKKMILTK
ncbi:MAG: T9SS type A sorting domain-containing protein [Bacteroidetes bacterium]|nr:T9SS type A sorting domain-containing protein [Bacteroidota bacterium]